MSKSKSIVSRKDRNLDQAGERLDSRKKRVQRNEGLRAVGEGDGRVTFVDRNESRKSGSRKNSVKPKIRGERREKIVDVNSAFVSLSLNGKRKRTYADEDVVEKRRLGDISKTKNRKSFSRMVHNKLQIVKGKSHEPSPRGALLRGRGKINGAELTEKKTAKGGVKRANKMRNAEADGSANGMPRKSDKSKYESRKQLDHSQSSRVAISLQNSSGRKERNKKSTKTDPEATDDRPKRKKRVIRIDPHDISNKRLDDDTGNKESSREKVEDSGKGTSNGMSKNAQFRAIQPSPSILSFVEDNLLGRRREIEFRRAGYNTELSAPLDNIPFSASSERERIEETVFRNKLTFFAAAKVSSSFPPPELPEIAFAGRSNVGKSSLLNALTRQWGVVRTSDKPGLTQTLNFFKLGPKLCLVDLPGYGFAYAKDEVKEAWVELVKEYVSTRVGVKRVCLLVDTKWGMKPRDHELIDLMERSQTKYQVVLTKTDVVFPVDVARRAMQIEESLKAKNSAVQPVMMVSSKTGAGIRSLRTVLAKIARFAKP